MGLGSLFFKQDDSKVATPATAPEQEAAPVAPARNSRAGSATKTASKAVAEPEEETVESDASADGGVDQKILALLEKALSDSKGKEYGYLQFRDTLAKMEKKIPNEGNRFTAALTAADSLGVDATKITASAQAALTTLAGELRQFNAEIKETQAADTAKQQQVADIETKIHTLQQQQTKLNKELATSAAELETRQANFNVTYKSLVAEIKGDIEKVGEYSTTAK